MLRTALGLTALVVAAFMIPPATQAQARGTRSCSCHDAYDDCIHQGKGEGYCAKLEQSCSRQCNR